MFKAIQKSHLPYEYKGCKVIGMGATSIVIDRDTKVEILTRDFIKLNLLIESEYVDDYRTVDNIRHNIQAPGFNDLDVYSLFMNKLEKHNFSTESRKESSKLFRKFKQIQEDVRESLGFLESRNLYKMNGEIMNQLLELDEEYQPLIDMAEAISNNWPGDTYIFDIGPRNMLWDENQKKIFINDPVVPLDLYKHMQPESYKYIMNSHYRALSDDYKMRQQKKQSNVLECAI